MTATVKNLHKEAVLGPLSMRLAMRHPILLTAKNLRAGARLWRSFTAGSDRAAVGEIAKDTMCPFAPCSPRSGSTSGSDQAYSIGDFKAQVGISREPMSERAKSRV
jgi:hypothetical protein